MEHGLLNVSRPNLTTSTCNLFPQDERELSLGLQTFRCARLSRMKQRSTHMKAHAHEGPWRVFVGFDNPKAHKRASEVCNLITHKFWPDTEFELQPCNLEVLNEPAYQGQAVKSAAEARIVIIATSATQDFAPPMQAWMNAVKANRHGLEGVVVGLIDPEAPEESRDSSELVLRQFAHQMGLDYLNHAPECPVLTAEEETESLEPRAAELGSVMESILTLPWRPVVLM